MKAKNKFQVERKYDLEETFNQLFVQGKTEKNFDNLYKLIVGENNILLAMKNTRLGIGRNIKGVDGKTVSYYEKLPAEKLIQIVKRRFNNFKPMKIRRIFIPKSNGKQRVLGIMTVEDRILHQCIKQILDPICESKFHSNSFGFRSLRSTKHAVNKLVLILQMTNYEYCVDVDIKDFFHNVDHAILIEQLYRLGVCDKKLLEIISKMLKAKVEGEGTKKVGLIQGGILSPLLSNVVLNELDWWINAQCKIAGKNPAEDRIYFVRYADDFKILCKSFSDAFKVFNVVKVWLKENLNLNVSTEKSKILNLKTQGSEFLGFKIKATVKNGVYSVESHISDDNKIKIKNKICQIISRLGNSSKKSERILKTLNQQINIVHGYYNSATHVKQDFAAIAEQCRKLLDDKLKTIAEFSPFSVSGKNISTYRINDTILIPIEAVEYKRLENLPPNLNIYTQTNFKSRRAGTFSKVSMKKYRASKKVPRSSEIEISHTEKQTSEEGLLATIKNFFSNLFGKKNTAP